MKGFLYLSLLFSVPTLLHGRAIRRDTGPGVNASDYNFGDVAEVQAYGQFAHWQSVYQLNLLKELRGRTEGCTIENIQTRQYWGTLCTREREEYANAVLCLQSKPSRYSKEQCPGCRSLFDDFLATHLNNSNIIHFSGVFFFFHRHFTWLYEQALRNECGYTGTQPYWDWTLSYNAPWQSPVFDGSMASLGGNGEYIPHEARNVSAFGVSYLDPPGTGGGCVKTGPFVNYTVSLGPVTYEPVDGDNGLAYNPRCLSRDFNLYWSNQTKPTDLVRLFNESGDSLGLFDQNLEALNGVHAGGHFQIGGDPATDPFVSPGDPAFYTHHSQIDRIWTVWQALDFNGRLDQTYGTQTAFNVPPSPNVTLDTLIDFGNLDVKRPVSYFKSSIDGPYCYMYI